MNVTLVLAVATLATSLLGCSSGAAALDPSGRIFLSTAVNNRGADRPLVPGTHIRLDFGADGNLGVHAGCNHMGGSWRLADGRLRVTGGAMTEMGCDEARHAQDDWVFAFLASNPAVSLTDTALVLTSEDVEVRFLDRKVAEPDRPLVGPIWTLDTILDGDVAVGMPAGATATLQFLPDGTAAVDTGCNQGQVTITEATDGLLRFGAIALTKRACVGPGAEVERAVLAVLSSGDVAWSIDANALTLQAGPNGLILRAP